MYIERKPKRNTKVIYIKKELQNWVCEEFSQEKMYNKYVETMLEVMPDPNVEDPDAWLSEIEGIIKEYE